MERNKRVLSDSTAAVRKRLARANETEEQRAHRLEGERIRFHNRRANETPAQAALRLENDRSRNRRANETPAQAALRLENDRTRDRRANQTPEQHAQELEVARISDQNRRAIQRLSLSTAGRGRSDVETIVENAIDEFYCGKWINS